MSTSLPHPGEPRSRVGKGSPNQGGDPAGVSRGIKSIQGAQLPSVWLCELARAHALPFPVCGMEGCHPRSGRDSALWVGGAPGCSPKGSCLRGPGPPPRSQETSYTFQPPGRGPSCYWPAPGLAVLPARGPRAPQAAHPTHVLTDLPVAISTADLSPPHRSNGLDPRDLEEMGGWSPRSPAWSPAGCPGCNDAGKPSGPQEPVEGLWPDQEAGGQSSPASELSSRVGLRLLGCHAAALVRPRTGHRATSYPSPASRPRVPRPASPEHGPVLLHLEGASRSFPAA